MRLGTKSILFGAHQFLIHPWFVAWAWNRLYGFPLDPRLWVAFFVHDLGYWGKPNMDGPEGETHPAFGAFLMHLLFGGAWADFVYYHSRYLAKREGKPFSKLCVADKLAIALTPAWLYLPMATATGEIKEYLRNGYDKRVWYRQLRQYMREWVEAHKNGDPDTWTSCDRHAADAGVSR